MTNKNNNTGTQDQQDQLPIPGTEPAKGEEIPQIDPEKVGLENRKLKQQMLEMETKRAKEYEEMKSMREKVATIDGEKAKQLDLEREAEEKKLKEKGNYEQLMEKQSETYKTKERDWKDNIKQEQTKTMELRSLLADTRINSELSIAIGKHKVIEGAHGIAVNTLKETIKLGDDNTTLLVHNRDTGEPTSINDLVDDFFKKNDYMIRDDSPGGSGSPKQTVNNNEPKTVDDMVNGISLRGIDGGYKVKIS